MSANDYNTGAQAIGQQNGINDLGRYIAPWLGASNLSAGQFTGGTGTVGSTPWFGTGMQGGQPIPGGNPGPQTPGQPYQPPGNQPFYPPTQQAPPVTNYGGTLGAFQDLFGQGGLDQRQMNKAARSLGQPGGPGQFSMAANAPGSQFTAAPGLTPEMLQQFKQQYFPQGGSGLHIPRMIEQLKQYGGIYTKAPQAPPVPPPAQGGQPGSLGQPLGSMPFQQYLSTYGSPFGFNPANFGL